MGGRDGPPMMRIMMIQFICEGVSKMAPGKLGWRGKALVILMVTSYFIMGDLINYRDSKWDNIYAQVGLTRQAEFSEIDAALTQYRACIDFEPECEDPQMNHKIFKMTKEDVRDIFYVLKNPKLRE